MKKQGVLLRVTWLALAVAILLSTALNAQPPRNEADELAYVGAIANSLTQNAQGHWEADFGDGIVMIFVPEGTFTMGNNAHAGLNASPEHQVTLSHYWISKTPITKGQFRTFVTATSFVTEVEQPGHPGPYALVMPGAQYFDPTPGDHWDNTYDDVIAAFPAIQINDDHPVSCVSWNDAIHYTNWLRDQNQVQFTIPSEAEWEYAARGTDGRVYPWGNQTPDGTRANYADETMNQYFPNLGQAEVHFGVTDSFALTSPVGSFPAGASPIGALDMAGNLTEWVYDADYTYTASPKTDPIHIQSNGLRHMKAGFWCGSAGRPGVTPDEIINGHNIRSDARQGDDENSADDHLGFRIAISYTQRLEPLLSVEDAESTSSNIVLLQNPVTNGNLVVQNARDFDHYAVLDLKGSMLNNGKLSSAPIDVSSLSTGVYVLSLTGTKTGTTKFIVSK